MTPRKPKPKEKKNSIKKSIGTNPLVFPLVRLAYKKKDYHNNIVARAQTCKIRFLSLRAGDANSLGAARRFRGEKGKNTAAYVLLTKSALRN